MSDEPVAEGRMAPEPCVEHREKTIANVGCATTGIETAPAEGLGDSDSMGSAMVLKADLLADAYPRDEPMQSDMSDYQQVVEPNLSLEERSQLNAAREARMTGDSLSSLDLQSLAVNGSELLAVFADLLRQCCQGPPVDDKAMQLGDTIDAPSRFRLGIPLSMAVSLHQAAMSVLTGMPQFIESNVAVVNVVLWIVVLELWHSISGCFTAIGLPLLARVLQGVSSLFLLRCYYALIARTSALNIECPALHSLRLLTLSAFEGIRNPASKRPPVLSVILVIRATLLVQNLYHSWLSALLRIV